MAHGINQRKRGRPRVPGEIGLCMRGMGSLKKVKVIRWPGLAAQGTGITTRQVVRLPGSSFANEKLGELVFVSGKGGRGGDGWRQPRMYGVPTEYARVWSAKYGDTQCN